MAFDFRLNVVFNGCMDKEKLAFDRALIAGLGGPAKLAEKLGLTKDGSVQRVQNWTTRGIPWKVRAQHPAMFPPYVKPVAKRKQQPQGAGV